MEAVKSDVNSKPIPMDGVRTNVFLFSLLILTYFVLRGFLGGLRLENWPDASVFALITVLMVYLRKELERREFPDRVKILPIVSSLEYICILTVLSGLIILAQYGAVWGEPLVMNDKFLMKLDSLFFGFNWFRFNSLVVSSFYLSKAVKIIYSLITPSIVILTVLLLRAEKEEEVVRFIMFITVTSALTITVFHLFPVVGPIKDGSVRSIIDRFYLSSISAASQKKGTFLIGVQSLDGFRGIIKGDTYTMRGAVCLPSYHAVLAFGYMYFAKYLSRTLHIGFIILASLMCISAVPAGNHFLIDIVSGGLTALIGICLIPEKPYLLTEFFGGR